MNLKFGKRLSALLLSAAVAAGSVVSAGACCGLYIGSDETVTGSTYVGRSEDIGKLYDKVSQLIALTLDGETDLVFSAAVDNALRVNGDFS